VAALDAFVKDRHGFIGAANLNLLKVGGIVVAGRTHRFGAVHIFPGRGAAQDIIHLFSRAPCRRRVSLFSVLVVHGAGVGTRRAVEMIVVADPILLGTNLLSY